MFRRLLQVCGAALALGGAVVPTASAATLPPIKHVFIIVGENEGVVPAFGPTSTAPYLAKTLPSQGAYLPNYYGIGHASLDNYIAMVSGQDPNPKTSGDCPQFIDFPAGAGVDASGQQTDQGCVYPANVPTLMSQMDSAHLTWKGYMDSMGSDLTRDGSATCSHPALGGADNTEIQTAADQYATRHDPFVYFHYVIDNAAECNANVVNLTHLTTDLQSASTTPNYSFITPGLCNDGHDSNCPGTNGTGGLPQFNTFLQTWVPKILASPAYQDGGLLIVTFDESGALASTDATACCGETPGPYDTLNGIMSGGSGPGGGAVGAVLLSPYIKAGTQSVTAYNHFSMLGTIEDLFGLSPIAAAAQPGVGTFGSDVFTNPTGATGPTGSTGSTGSTGQSTTTQPTLSMLKITPRSFLPGTSTKKQKRGAKITYTDTAPAKTTLMVTPVLTGKKVAPVGRITHNDRIGTNTIVFAGRFAGHTLPAGTYTLSATPKFGTVTGRTISVRFRVT